jgi:hypothetical protein
MAINYTYPVKGSPITSDEFLIIDSADNSTKKVTVANVLALGQGGDVGVASLAAVSPISNIGTSADVNLTLNTVPIAKGGTNLTALGTAFQVMGVNESGDALAYTDVKVSETVVADEAIAKGDPLYISNDTGGNVHVSKADAGNALKMPAVGLASEDISNGATGTMLIVGLLEDVRNNDIPSTAPNPVTNDIIYVANGGGLTSIKPTGTNLIQNVAIVVKTGNSGSLQITAIGRSNDVPNIPSTQMWVGSSTGVATPRTLTGEVTISDTGVTEVTGIDGNVSIQGYRPIVQVTASGSIETSDAGATLVSTDNSGGNIVLDIRDDVAYAVGTEIQIIQKGNSSVEVTSSGNTSINGGGTVSILAQYGSVTLKKYATDDWMAFGDI